MGLLQETCDAIHSRSKEIEQHIIKNWNDASDSKQYGRLVNMVAQYGAATNQKECNNSKTLYDHCLCRSWRCRYGGLVPIQRKPLLV